MKPILILQHLSADGPAYLATWLQAQGVAFDVRNTEAGDAFPSMMDGYGALAILGGEMSANDPLPSLRQAEALFLQAVQAGAPTLGHCLGGQLMARALGAAVADSPQPEVGWQRIRLSHTPSAADWFGAEPELTVFHWHFESFALPRGATLLASNTACPHQAFAIGPHLAMQFHVELDEEKLTRWSLEATARDSGARLAHPHTVQTGQAMRAAGAQLLAAQQRLADRIYTRWLGASRQS
jgi:GMP synthase (glutamine-hydrolysing)